VQAKLFFFAEMMCKQLIFCVKAATRPVCIYLITVDLLALNMPQYGDSANNEGAFKNKLNDSTYSYYLLEWSTLGSPGASEVHNIKNLVVYIVKPLFLTFCYESCAKYYFAAWPSGWTTCVERRKLVLEE
jgi:hypothetical protein